MYFKDNGVNMYYEVYGEGNSEVILILPGWGDTRKTFKRLIKKLEKDYKVYIFDYPGFGNTLFPNRDLDIYDYVILFKNFIKKKNIIKPSIIAHSFGGRITLILSSYIEFKKIILIDIAGIRRKSLKRIVKNVLYKVRKKLVIFKKNKIKYLINLRKKYSSSDYSNLSKNMYTTFKNIVNEDLRKYIRRITTPTLIIWGELDLDTPLKDGYYLNRKIKNSKLVVYPNKGHFVYLEEEDVENKIKIFLLN